MVDGGDHSLEQNLERASDARDKALEAASAKWESKDIPAWAITLQDSLRALHQGFGVPMAEAVTSALETRTEAVAKAQEALSKVAGGAKNGELWHSTKAPGTPILEHFVATLDKFLAKPESFQHLIDNLQAAVNKCKSLRAQYVDLLAEADHQDITGEALKCLQRAHMTKLEVKCARCLRKSNQQKRQAPEVHGGFCQGGRDGLARPHAAGLASADSGDPRLRALSSRQAAEAAPHCGCSGYLRVWLQWPRTLRLPRPWTDFPAERPKNSCRAAAIRQYIYSWVSVA